MAQKGKALLVGLKSVDPNCYGGWNGQGGCWGCELDVDNVEAILAPLGYDIDILKTQQATAAAILDGLNNAAAALNSGDIFVFYFSGHGGQQPDQNGDEMDGKDETLVAYNRQIVDDELSSIWYKFRAGVRIVMISDSCNSGTNYRNRMNRAPHPTPMVPIPDFQVASMMRAKLIHFGGCRDGFGSSGFTHGGAFTLALCEAWNNGGFRGNYPDFHQAICAKISTSQQPQYSQYGSGLETFRNQKPFTIATMIPLPPVLYEYEIFLPVNPPPWLHQLIPHIPPGGIPPGDPSPVRTDAGAQEQAYGAYPNASGSRVIVRVRRG
ncbi:MAG TPA: caspase family protein [Desulfosalsimonadaceae bacterium]|nr:caspase family protein [Desulfosalsimonadaceae bacterium]